VVKCGILEFLVSFLSNRGLVGTCGDLKLVVDFGKLFALKQKTMVLVLGSLNIFRYLVGLGSSSAALPLSLELIALLNIGSSKICLVWMCSLIHLVRGKALLIFSRWISLYLHAFLLYLGLRLYDGRLCSLGMLLSLEQELILSQSELLELKVVTFTTSIWQASTVSNGIHRSLSLLAVTLLQHLVGMNWFTSKLKWLLETAVLYLIELSHKLRAAPTTRNRGCFGLVLILAQSHVFL